MRNNFRYHLIWWFLDFFVSTNIFFVNECINNLQIQNICRQSCCGWTRAEGGPQATPHLLLPCIHPGSLNSMLYRLKTISLEIPLWYNGKQNAGVFHLGDLCKGTQLVNHRPVIRTSTFINPSSKATLLYVDVIPFEKI